MANNRQRGVYKKLLLDDAVPAILTDSDGSCSDENDEYFPPGSESDSDDSVMQTRDQNDDLEFASEDNNDEDVVIMDEDIGVSRDNADGIDNVTGESTSESTSSTDHQDIFVWSANLSNFSPRMNVPAPSDPIILADVDRSSTNLDVFFELFPKVLFEEIAKYTNMRLEILRQENPRFRSLESTTPAEIMVVLGCNLVISYNRLPAIDLYWSTSKSLGNSLIKSAIARDRFQVLYSKLYFNEPQQPADASKIYYAEKVMDCIRKTCIAARSDSPYQSIDESMTKFKGRSCLKQYMPMKPVKRGIQLWARCDAKTGYVYDIRVYCGKEDTTQQGTLGERVVTKLCSTITSPQVLLVFDRFFTSVKLMSTLPYPAIGTYMKSRKHTPSLEAKLERGESEMVTCQGVLACHWKDTKDVLAMSNCHEPAEVLVNRKDKTGVVRQVPCPAAIADYNKYMGGVDLHDQMVTLYELDRKSRKWWRKVFFRMLMVAVHNSFVVFCETQRKKIPFLNYLVSLAEGLIDYGRSRMPWKRTRKVGRRLDAAKLKPNIGNHFPVKEQQRRRCVRCAARKKERRTKIMCQKCNVPLCMDCFTSYHT